MCLTKFEDYQILLKISHRFLVTTKLGERASLIWKSLDLHISTKVKHLALPSTKGMEILHKFRTQRGEFLVAKY